jgi:hypothetical protein
LCGQFLPDRNSQVEYYFAGFPKGRNYFRGIEDALHFSESKVSSCQNHPTRPEAGKIEKHIKTERFPSRVLWREMKGMGEIGGNIKG